MRFLKWYSRTSKLTWKIREHNRAFEITRVKFACDPSRNHVRNCRQPTPARNNAGSTPREEGGAVLKELSFLWSVPQLWESKGNYWRARRNISKLITHQLLWTDKQATVSPTGFARTESRILIHEAPGMPTEARKPNELRRQQRYILPTSVVTLHRGDDE
ncbi:hypothetical protein K0M31_012133 [Melipona bicolor]|uniref:Uncharacterized protein n=1 Tax=Melipona bicolor TaxID=60889 RepID=A0AA40KVE1_9HYME|nr:hypothetical protein K0M31_012133 [Melipona bicolor]